MALKASIYWPGAGAVVGFEGSVSHGITPSVFLLTIIPRPGQQVAEFGELVFGDSANGVIRLKDCKVSGISSSTGPAGTTWTLQILDRRWKWAGGSIGGRYNRRDKRGKLVPWTIRSPEELAKLCLQEAGETRYVIKLPRGLPRAAGANLTDYLQVGQNLPQTMANPPVVWADLPPMQALARLAEQFGCRVIYQPKADRVLVVPLGEGKDLPRGIPIESAGGVLDSPETPSELVEKGAPTRYQARFVITPVGKEWDTSFREIDLLSYAPTTPGKPQITEVTYTGDDDTAVVGVFIGANLRNDPNDLTYRSFSVTDPGVTVEDKWATIAAQISNDPVASKACSAVNDGRTLRLTGQTDGVAFAVDPYNPLDAAAPGLVVKLVQVPQKKGNSWRFVGPPLFFGVRATDRLSRNQAEALAQQHVFRSYRLKFVDVTTRRPPIKVPGFNRPIKRRQQIILQPTRVEQMVPEPRIAGARNQNALPGSGGILDYYDGYSSDREAIAYGSVAAEARTLIYEGKLINTPTGDRIPVRFSIDPYEQVITFSEPVFRWELVGQDQVYDYPDLVLETAVLVEDADSGDFDAWEKSLPLGGAGSAESRTHEDIQVGYIARYTDTVKNQLTGVEADGLADANARADHYLKGRARAYELTGGNTYTYPAVVPVEPDGHIQQVSWSIGTGGFSTTASENSEHNYNVPPYPERRRAENLPPDASAALANVFEQFRLEKGFPDIFRYISPLG